MLTSCLLQRWLMSSRGPFPLLFYSSLFLHGTYSLAKTSLIMTTRVLIARIRLRDILHSGVNRDAHFILHCDEKEREREGARKSRLLRFSRHWTIAHTKFTHKAISIAKYEYTHFTTILLFLITRINSFENL